MQTTVKGTILNSMVVIVHLERFAQYDRGQLDVQWVYPYPYSS